MNPNHSGVYAIIVIATGQTYVGSSRDVRKRWIAHRSNLRNGSHSVRALQRAWSASGPKALRFKLLQRCTSLERFEQEWIERTRKCLNRARASSVSVSVRINMSRGHTGLAMPQETRAKIARTLRGRSTSPETRRKLAAAARRQWREKRDVMIVSLNRRSS